MKSPFSARGRVRVAAPNDSAPARVMVFQLSRSLTTLRAQDVVVDEERVSFRGAVMRAVWGWNLLRRPLDHATVRIHTSGDEVLVDYELRLVEAPLLTVAVACVSRARLGL